MQSTNKYIQFVTYLLLFGVFIFLSSNKHSHSRKNNGYLNYHGVMWADQAGYNVYLPAAFIYNFNAKAFPDSIDVKTGRGFTLYPETGIVKTKYTYGVALLQAPFFVIAHLTAPALGYPADGFSAPYHWAIDVAAAFYLILALFFLSCFLKSRYTKKVVNLTLLSLVLATNLFYYSVDDTGMSHIYSFFLFCLFLYIINKTNYLSTKSTKLTADTGFIAALIILTRPTNIIFLSALLFLDITNIKDVIIRLRNILSPKTLILLVITAVIVFLPQFMYWHYATGNWFNYSYGDEGFIWLRPLILVSWFSPDNGLFLYTPFFFVIIAALVVMVKHRSINGLYIFTIFITLSYLLSCWWDWDFGCAFGARSYVEYLALFSIPVATLYQYILRLQLPKQLLFIILVTTLALYNLKMTYSYDNCYSGVLDAYWDWDAYIKHLTAPVK